MSALARFSERLRQNREARRQTLADTGALESRTRARTGVTFTPGTVVFDTVTGLEGEVVFATRENVVVPAPQR